ncbi:MAG TPA: response regulator [Caldilineae bacterium]|jgi:CheY-like chemotaxis protein|nr:response regulator [Caldilineae bacterium]
MNKRVLVIDDEPELIKLVSIFLGMAGFEVVGAHDGLSAIENLERLSPDLVICDMVMPAMDGIETIKAIRAHPRMSSIPIIMLSARGQMDEIERALAVGANDYIMKPFSGAEVIRIVKKYLSREPSVVPN